MERFSHLLSAAFWRPFTPKLVTVLKEGYGAADLRQDVIAGVTVAIVALPLAMALAIASGTTPDKGLITAIVAGFLISALGGSRVQIGGPTGAFVVVVFNVIAEHGYDGLVIATLMAGIMLIVAGLARLGTWIKYIPEPVITGFTAGIAVIIFTSQIKDLLGLPVDQVPADFIDKIKVFAANMDGIALASVIISGVALAVILLLRRHAPRAPAFLIVVVGASVLVALFGIETDTIGSRFGGIPSSLPAPALPDISFARMADLLPSAFTIAFLAGVESLLSAVVADGMTGYRHRSNTELVAQGVANSASALFGGLPATGAIARTATNIRSGARSPLSGIFHALFLLLAVLFLAPLADYVPLAALAAVLVMVAWNMSDAPRFRHLLAAPPGDVAVLLITFALTVLVDLTLAIQVGVVLAALLFMHRMAEVVALGTGPKLIHSGDEREIELLEEDQRQGLPPGIEVFQIQGPLFFGVANRLNDFLEALRKPPKIMILRLRHVPLIDASGVTAFDNFITRCRRAGIRLILSGLQPQPRAVLHQMGVDRWPETEVRIVTDYAAARLLAEQELQATE